MTTVTRIIVTAAMVLSMVGCASIDFDYPRTESHALTDTAETHLGKQIIPVVATKPEDQSGFYPMNDGIDALEHREAR